MAKEIERKFLVKSDSYRKSADSIHQIIQTYLSVSPESTVRIRILDEQAFITVKSKNQGATRNEWEYPIPSDDAREMIAACACSPVIEKTRYRAGRWEIDEFHGTLAPLVVAEIELTDADEPIEVPDFIGREVTGDVRYYNSVLASTGELPPLS